MNQVGSPVSLLIVDDNPGDRGLYRQYLIEDTEREYRFVEAGLGEEGLQHCRSGHIDCVLLDYRLPDLDGVEFLALLAGNGGAVPIPVVMLTGQGNETIAVEALQAGAEEYLPKGSVSTGALKRAINNAVEKHRLRVTVAEKRVLLEHSNRQLVCKNEEIQCFYHSVSHELKTPLTAVREFVSMVLDGIGGPLSDSQTEYLNIAKDGCDQITSHLNDLLDATRLETGKLRISPQARSIASIITKAVASMMPSADKKEISLEHAIQADLSDVFIDDRRIVQVLTNLISNALKFTEKGGRAMVTASNDLRCSDKILVSVQDTGCGIEPEQIDRIFDRLYQVQSVDAAPQDGLGLGLNICQELVALHGGEFDVESTKGIGTKFSFRLPKHTARELSENVIEDQVL